jgi:hypothetical protein
MLYEMGAAEDIIAMCGTVNDCGNTPLGEVPDGRKYIPS